MIQREEDPREPRGSNSNEPVPSVPPCAMGTGACAGFGAGRGEGMNCESPADTERVLQATARVDQAKTRQTVGVTERDLAVYPLLAAVFEYPGEGTKKAIDRAVDALRDSNVEAANALERFRDTVGEWTPGRWEELHVRTFDVAPQCVPYLSVHVFGEESFKRAQLMTGLRESYARAGFNHDGELPDHLAVVLRFFPCFSEDERLELVHYCLVDAIEKMSGSLKKADNPYVHVLCAVLGVLKAHYPREAVHG